MARVAILLSTYNGQRFLAEQLDSVAAQSYRDWVLYWRDDGSTDATRRLTRVFLDRLGPGRAVRLDDNGRVGATESFLRLLRAAVRDGQQMVAFADQDDVWLPEKLARGAAALDPCRNDRPGIGTNPPLPLAGEIGPHRGPGEGALGETLDRRCAPTSPVSPGEASGDVPALYFARQQLVDAGLRPIGLPPPLRRPPGFPAALTQNLATGCTLMLNRAAAELVAASTAPAAACHDWWCYLVVAGAGGRLLSDATPTVLYRQHAGNVVGAPASSLSRGLAAVRRGPDAFMNILRQNVFALADQPHLLAPAAAAQAMAIARALRGGPLDRWRALRLPGLRRQTWQETLVFRLWFLLG